MELYIVIIEDHHTDTSVHAFSNKDRAISEAKKIAKELCRFPDDYHEYNYGRDSGWLFYAEYSCENDSVRVMQITLDESNF